MQVTSCTPEVSIVTPTYNRREFIPILLKIYANQTFPKEKMEWIIVDDGQDNVEDLFLEASTLIPNIRYIKLDEKLRIGAKRNYLNKQARAPIIIAVDDDDYYSPHRVQTIVDVFQKYPKADLVGSSEMHLYYTDTKKLYTVGPYQPNHATNNTMAWRKRYSDTHKHDEFVTKAEEKSFLDDYTHPMIQLDPSTILHICHTDNTVDKQRLRKVHLSDPRQAKEKMRACNYTLSDLVNEKDIYSFYSTFGL